MILLQFDDFFDKFLANFLLQLVTFVLYSIVCCHQLKTNLNSNHIWKTNGKNLLMAVLPNSFFVATSEFQH